MTKRRQGLSGLVLALGSAAVGCGDEELFALQVGTAERVIASEAIARLANLDQWIDEPLVVGDLDGDGTDDAVVRTKRYTIAGDKLVDQDSVFVAYGGSQLAGNIDLATLPSLTGSGRVMAGVEAVGDVDGDGLADFLVGVADVCGGAGDQHSGAYLVYGSATRLAGATALHDTGVLLRDAVPCTTANAMAGLGDLDGDGKADFALGRYDHGLKGTPAEPPAVFVFYGRAQRLSGVVDLAAADATIAVPARFAIAPPVMQAGDVDGDGLGDFVVGVALGTVEAQQLDLQLVTGSASRLAGTVALADIADTRLPSAACFPRLGRLGSALGDLDGDGADDFSLADCEAIPGTPVHRLVHRVFYGRTGGLPPELGNSDAVAEVTTSHSTYTSGNHSELTAGDVDGDGALDLVLADQSLRNSNGGVHLIRSAGARFAGTIDPVAESYVTYVGTPQRLPACVDAVCTPPELVGYGISIGDVTGDGRGDVLVGAADYVVQVDNRVVSISRAYVLSPAAGPRR